jgi:hypothetical protein
MALREPASLEEKILLIREEKSLFAYLENAGRPVSYNHSLKRYDWVIKNRCETCGDDEPWICLIDTGIAICPRCASLLLRAQF